MEIDVYCKDDKCPICERPIIPVGYNRRGCQNSCYVMHNIDSYGSFGFNVFREYFFIDVAVTQTLADRNESILEEVRERIKYWKEDYRYVAELLDR